MESAETDTPHTHHTDWIKKISHSIWCSDSLPSLPPPTLLLIQNLIQKEKLKLSIFLKHSQSSYLLASNNLKSKNYELNGKYNFFTILNDKNTITKL